MLTDLKTREEDTVEKSHEAMERVEKAEAKTAIAQTKGAVAHSMAVKHEDDAQEQVCSRVEGKQLFV